MIEPAPALPRIAVKLPVSWDARHGLGADPDAEENANTPALKARIVNAAHALQLIGKE